MYIGLLKKRLKFSSYLFPFLGVCKRLFDIDNKLIGKLRIPVQLLHGTSEQGRDDELKQ